MRFESSGFLPAAAVLAVVFIVHTVWRNYRFNKITFSNINSLKKSGKSVFSQAVYLPDVLKIIGIILLVIALIRPQGIRKEDKEKIKGIDIIITLDVSGSMQAEDLKPNRLEAAKDVCRQFVSGLANDRVGLVVFAGKSFSQCPLTVDYEIVKNFINLMDLKTVRIDGTAIGEALLTSVNRLEASQGSKIIILTTDGRNNRGINPVAAAQVAAAKNIKIYTIGIGKKGGANMTFFDQYGIKRQAYDRFSGKQMKWEEPDEETLKQIAGLTGGKYFRAADEQALKDIYQTIAKLEKQEIQIKVYNRYIDRFWAFLLAGVLLLLTALVLEVFKYTRVLA